MADTVALTICSAVWVAALDAAVSVMLKRALMADTVALTTCSAVRVAALEIFKATCTPWMSAISVVRRSDSAELLLAGATRYAHKLVGKLQMENESVYSGYKVGHHKSTEHNKAGQLHTTHK